MIMKIKEFIKTTLLLVVIVLSIYYIASFFRDDDNKKQVCECFEVVGDEGNFICYTPLGEVDTKGECVGPRTYK